MKNTTLISTAITELHFCPMMLFGVGTLDRVGELTRRYGSKALLVTDKGVQEAGISDRVARGLSSAQVEMVLFDGVSPNPDSANVEAGLQAGSGHGIEVIVSVGGGSSHDCAKAIALVAANGGQIGDYEGVGLSAHPSLPIVAINTTAGSGAEM
ncbi:MAG: iron-containing alcohol dehydrogenase, partial [Thermoguttaceae bacterium]